MKTSCYPEPQAVFRHFYAISKLPHGSGHTDAIRAYCLQVAADCGKPASADAAGNVILHKPATAGYADRPAVLLQGHLDMVCTKRPDCAKDLLTEGLDLQQNGDWLSATDTSLGGDDGIGVAFALAILEDDTLLHPALTILLTNDEEIGMLGATALDEAALDGSFLINLDTEEEGVIVIGCAGGVRVCMSRPVVRTPVDGLCCRMTLSGLQGGHSGTEIHRPLLNANCGLQTLLSALTIPFRLCRWEGGQKDNVIPTHATASILLAAADRPAIFRTLSEAAAALRTAYPEESNLKLELRWTSVCDEPALSVSETRAVLSYLKSLPNGVYAYDSSTEPRQPAVSSNLGIVTLTADTLFLDCLVRSVTAAGKQTLVTRLQAITERFGGQTTLQGDYPAWEPQTDTPLLQAVTDAYQTLFHNQPTLQTIHAGVECGILAAKSKHLSCISMGPTILDIHSPRERLSVSSTARTWQLLLQILQTFGSQHQKSERNTT